MQPLLRFLALSPSGAPIKWPEPLHAFVSHGKALVETASSLHDLAARLVEAHPEAFEAILVSPRTLTLRHIPLLDTIARHKPLSIWLLPTTAQIDPSLREALEKRARNWQEASSQLLHLLQKASTQHSREGNSRIPLPPESSLPPTPRHLSDPPESPQSDTLHVPPPPTPGYDGLIAPRLSDLELRVLLGAEKTDS